MNAILIILISMLIAGVIGLFTNIIAIGMLFRPYGARYIGKKKVTIDSRANPETTSRHCKPFRENGHESSVNR
ncbi:hypothetical protein [Geomicrobium sp. JCM 19037]|uniref:hypothetical protein n=1 Tax=Geomicrobium sp. JCM 19037 TaxID=1460634 RepID=UPI0005AA9CCA|nr:hypothetical protein [Geomicrobium sp. JCM 19037]